MRDGMSVDRAVARGGVETGGLRIQHPRYLAGKAPEAKIRSRARMADGRRGGGWSWSLVLVVGGRVASMELTTEAPHDAKLVPTHGVRRARSA